MSSSDNIASLEPWFFRPTFPDTWISEAYARDTETLTKALQKSLYKTTTTVATNSNHSFSASDSLTSDSIDPFLNLIASETVPPTPTGSNVSGSDPETAPPKRRSAAVIGVARGKVTKRKSRASKRSETTFISADPANFRQMVQQVTGVRFENSQLPIVPVLKPEPHRIGNRMQAGLGGCLPTLDTSAFLLDHNQQQVALGSNPVTGAVTEMGSDQLDFPQSLMADGGGGGAGSGLDFDTFSGFPTLESWKVL